MSNLATATWRKSTRSGGNNGNCVEMARAGVTFGVRDSKDKASNAPILEFDTGSMGAFVAAVKSGAFDL